MGFLDRFKKAPAPKPEESKPEPKPERPKTGTVSFLWGPQDRRQADQEELEELQKKLSETAQKTVDLYKPVFHYKDEGKWEPVMFDDLPSYSVGLLAIIAKSPCTVGGIPSDIDTKLSLKKGGSESLADDLAEYGYVRKGAYEDRINAMKYPDLIEALGKNGITISTNDKVERVKEIMEKTEPAVLDKILKSVPKLYVVTDKGKDFLTANPFASDLFSGKDEYGIDVNQAAKLIELDKDMSLFESCRKAYMELMTAHWALKEYKEYFEYSKRLAYLEMRNHPKEAAFAMAHVINGNNVYNYRKLLWEAPLQLVYQQSSITIEDMVRYVGQEMDMGMYPKRTKRDQVAPVFKKSLGKIKKVR